MVVNRSFTILFFVLLFILLVLSSSGFSYVDWNPTIGGRILRVFDLFFLFFFLKVKKQTVGLHFTKFIKQLVFLSFLSVIGNVLLHSGNFVDAIIGNLSHSCFLFYFVLHYCRITEKQIMNLLLGLALIVFIIQVVQQFMFPLVLFGLRSLDDPAINGANDILEIRNGLYRFRIPALFTLVSVFFCWQQLQKRLTVISFVSFMAMVISIYLFLTRQLLFSVTLSIFLSIFFVKGMRSRILISVLLLLLAISYNIWGELFFGELMESTKEEVGENNIRVSSAFFFLQKIFSNPISFFLGNGSATSLGIWGQKWGYWITDVGFIGESYLYGVIYILVYPMTLWKVYRYRAQIPLYVKMYTISTLLMSVMIFPYCDRLGFLIWAVVLYICDLHINKSKLRCE